MINKGDNMLKNTRKRLIQELNNFNEELKKAKAKHAELESEYTVGHELLNAINYQKNTSSALYGGMLPASAIILLGGAAAFAFWEFIGPGIIIGELLFAAFYGRVTIKNYKRYKESNKRLETAQDKAEEENFNFIGELDIFENDLDIRVKYLMDKEQKNIAMYEDSIKNLWGILTSNNLIGTLEQSHDANIDTSSALLAEWEAYLEELANTPISAVHLETDDITEDCYKESTQKFHVEPKKIENNVESKKLENKPTHQFSIY